MLQRGVMTLLLLVLSVTAMWADQAIVVDITGGHNTWSLQVDGEAVTSFNASGEATVSGKNGKTAVLTLTPETGYTVTNFIIYTTYDFLSPSPTRINPGATQIDYGNSGDTYTFTMPADEANGVYIKATIINSISTSITSLSEITDTGGTYIITSDISDGTPGVTTFNGTLEAAIDPETHMPYRISGLSAPLFTTLTGTVKNLVLEGVSISSGDDDGNTGAIACTAKGDARIYNVGILSGSVGGSGNTGGLVGLLDGSARVINCYSFADITSGSDVGGIVGHNNVATASDNLKTMVFACMFYGDITGGSSIAPIYNGNKISNQDSKGVSNFNYFRLEAPYVQPTGVTYNCALGAEDRFLQRFEFFRHLLNSHRELAGWWATGTYSSSDMMKWVLEPSQLDSDTPYPILKVSGKYPSVVNIDAEHATTQTERNKGGKLGTLTVNIQMGDGAVFQRPSEAQITTSQLILNITDKDPDHFNFNYYKVQLPYYNDVGTKNYNGNRVVTGWKIVSITGGTPGSFTTGDDATTDANGNITSTPYNFADRNCTNKDLYSVSGRVFNQGAYWDVPEGVTVITIEPYWALAAYVADTYPDVVYNSGMGTKYDVLNVGGGQKYKNNTSYSIAGEQQKVFTTINDAVTAANGLNKPTSNTVNDYAVVLVGNVHQYTGNNKPIGSNYKYTLTSIDLDHDNEPDYSFMLRNDGRNQLHPVKWDLLNVVGLGMAQKATDGKGSYNHGIFQPIDWFEVTNTALFRVTQFEYDRSTRGEAPLILQGGVMEQWVSGQSAGASNKTTYFHVGGNVWFKEFHRGCHQDSQLQSKHTPISVTGGDYDEFYLTGLYKAYTTYNDNAECYINGGHFGTLAGTGQEGIGDATNHTKGNIIWQIQNADIDEFYGGSFNAASPMQGSISTVINGSHVAIFCGGPKFGDMQSGKTVVTTATNCTFGTYFGAGYGGNSYSRQAPYNYNSKVNIEWNKWVKGEIKAETDGNFNGYKLDYKKKNYNRGNFEGVSTRFNYQFLPMSGNADNCARLFIEYVKFSLATTRNVTSTLTGCTITGNFYGGGSLGKVDGPVTSTLNNCTVNGSVFGAGYSASLPTVEADDINGFSVEPYYYDALGTYRTGVKGATTTFTWEHRDVVNSTETAIDKTNHILYTTEDLTTLGTVTGIATLNIEDGTTVAGSVYGGGESSDVIGNASEEFPGNVVVNINGGTINGNVHGGGYGKSTEIGGNVEVNIGSRTGTEGNYSYATCTADIQGDVYGGSALGSVNSNTANTTTVNLFGGTIHGDAYGGGLGQIGKEGKAAVGEVGDEGYQPAVPAIEDVKAQVKGTVYMTLDGAKFEVNNAPDDKEDQIPVSGRIFGCNNLNGSPEGNVNITIERTVGYNHQKTEEGKLSDPDDAHHSYELAAVYGGGNLAAYLPYNYENNLTAKAHITINGCDNVSIRQVYGGGNAASTPAAQIDVNGTYEIEELFGGGNGKDRIQKNAVWYDNPGANMGFLEYADNAENAQTPEDRASNYGYGSGETNVNIYGGRIHRVFGGANTKGNVRKIALTILEDENQCTFMVDEAYGGGKSASMDGAAELKMACIPGLKAAYGGAQEADINNDVTLNITNGTFDRVFGGNNKSGHITGTITVNIEETGCKPVIIGQVYGGGNLAPYTAPTKENGPTVNLKSFTSIGEVYGGGFGATAVVEGDTHVNINEVILSNTDTGQTTDYSKQNFTATEEITNVVTSAPLFNRPADTTNGSIGVIGNIYGGGNEAKVEGDTHVSIGNLQEVEINTLDKVEGNFQKKPVVGADIRGNVYGGGNKAEVTGNTNVVVGKSSE